MKKVFQTLLVFSTLFIAVLTGGCNKNQPLLFFNAQPITRQTINSPGRNFAIGQPIHYILVVPKGFKKSYKSEYIRAQIVKKDDKTPQWGYKIYQSRDFHIDNSFDYFINYFVIPEKGYYFMQIFSFDDFDTPIARNDFWVRDLL